MKKLFSVSKWCALALAVGVIIVGVPGDVFASTNTIAGFGINASGQSDALVGLASILAVLIKLFTFFSVVMLDLFGELMGTEMLTGKAAQEAMLPMWVWVRNLTNVGFVVALVALAFTNLFASFGGGEGEWTIKKKLPKIIIAMIAVNFSMLGFRLVIDAINVGTIAILGIADTRLEGGDSQQLNGLMSEHEWVQVDEASSFLTKGDIRKKPDEGTYWTPEIQKGLESGDDCSKLWDVMSKDESAEAKKTGVTSEVKVLYHKKPGTDGNNDEHFVCLSSGEMINRMFCGSHDDLYRQRIQDANTPALKESIRDDVSIDPDCLMMLDLKQYGGAGTSTREPESATELNLFMAFGTVFMHLENLPALGANLDKLGSVIDNTLFSGILSLAFLAALMAVFVALLLRLVVLWVAIVFSPLLVGASVLGFGNAGGGKISEMVMTHLIMPLKIAAAFAVSFVMVSAMVEFGMGGNGGTFFFGPALSQIGTNEYALLWQVATIVIFWKAAFWALEGNAASFITDKIKSGAEVLANTTAKSVTIDRQLFTVPGDKSGAGFSISNVMEMPRVIETQAEKKHNEGRSQMKTMLGMQEAKSDKAIATLTETIRDKHTTASTWNDVAKDAQNAGANINDVIRDKSFRNAMWEKNSGHVKSSLNVADKESFMGMSNADMIVKMRSWTENTGGATKDAKAWLEGKKAEDTSSYGGGESAQTTQLSAAPDGSATVSVNSDRELGATLAGQYQDNTASLDALAKVLKETFGISKEELNKDNVDISQLSISLRTEEVMKDTNLKLVEEGLIEKALLLIKGPTAGSNNASADDNSTDDETPPSTS